MKTEGHSLRFTASSHEKNTTEHALPCFHDIVQSSNSEPTICAKGYTALKEFSVPPWQRAKYTSDLFTAEIDSNVRDMLLHYTVNCLCNRGNSSNVGKSIFLYGPEGSGKTYLTYLIANSVHGALIVLKLSTLIQYPSLLDSVFEESQDLASVSPVCIVIDHCEALSLPQCAMVLNTLEPVLSTHQSLPMFTIFISRTLSECPQGILSLCSVHIEVPSPSLPLISSCLHRSVKFYTTELSVCYDTLSEDQVTTILEQVTHHKVYSFSSMDSFVRQCAETALRRASSLTFEIPPRVTWTDFESNLHLFSSKSAIAGRLQPSSAPRPTVLSGQNTEAKMQWSTGTPRAAATASRIRIREGQYFDDSYWEESEETNSDVEDEYREKAHQEELGSPKKAVAKAYKRGRAKRRHNSMKDIINNYHAYLFTMSEDERKTVPPSTKHDMEILWFGHQCIENFTEKFPNITAARNFVRNKMAYELSRWREAGKPVEKKRLLEAVYGRKGDERRV